LGVGSDNNYKKQHKRRILGDVDDWENESSLLHEVGRRRNLAEFSNKCPAGKEPFMSPAAIHQLHLFIFFVIAGHIVYTCVTIVIARAKVSRWHKWEINCQKKMSERKGAVSGQLSRALNDRDFILRRTGTLTNRRLLFPDVAPDVEEAASSSTDGRSDVAQHREDPDFARTFQEVVQEAAQAQEQWGQEEQARDQAREQEAGEQAREQEAEEQARDQARPVTKLQVQDYDDDDDVAGGEEMPQHFTWIGEEEEGGDLDAIYEEEEEREEDERKEKEWQEEEGRRRQEERQRARGRRSVRWSQEVGGGGVERGGAAEGEAGGSGGGGGGGGGGGTGGEGGGARRDGRRLTRSDTMARREASMQLTVWQSLVLTLQCFWQQLVNPITRSDYYTLRLAFIHNQHLPGNFDFYHHVVNSLEKDFVHIVGLSWHLWITLVIIIGITSYLWDTSFIFAILGFLITLAVGTKLEYIVSVLALESAHVKGDCEGDHLKPRGSLFWFKRPSFMLHLLHFALFVSSYMVGNMITFYYLAMNHAECKSYSTWVPWIKFAIGIITLLICSLSTLPLYALVTHMGEKPSPSQAGKKRSFSPFSKRKQQQVAPVPESPMAKIMQHRSKDDVRIS
ncbi:hypothetical protein CLOM_g22347, partial [Closterium sp. NIES-68]